MIKLLLAILVFGVSGRVVRADLPNPTAKYQHSAVLTPGEFAIYWNVTADSTLLLEVHSRTPGWLGFGFSLDESQKDTDVFVIWGSSNNDGTGHFSDRHKKNGGDLLVDKRQSWFIDDVTLVTDYMIMKVHRHIRVCDVDAEDIDIHQGLMNVIYKTGMLFDEDHVNPWHLNKIDMLKGANEGECQAEPEPVVYEFEPTGYYSNYVDLIDGVYRFYWNFTSEDIVGEIHCKTKGWVGFGLSPNGKMDKSDVVVGWITDDGLVNFTDRHIIDRQVLIDSSQDWHLLRAKEENGFTVFKFTRKIISCDPDDRIIETGSPHLIFSYGAADPKPNSDIGYHGALNRGTRQALLISGAVNKEQELDDVETMDFLAENIILPPADTIYYCQIMKVPDEFTQKRHIFKWELLMPKMNAEKIHHVLVYECPLKLTFETNPNGNCYTNQVRGQCQTISFGWAVGADLTHFFPTDTGYPIGGDTDYKYFYLEIHYDNPDMKLGYIDSMGLRLHMTKKLRKHELGILTLGTGASEYAISIPPGVERYELTTYCFKHCTEKLPHEITVILATPHTHLAGTGLYTKIVREGHEIGYLHQNKYYDFNFQNVYRLDPPVVLKPGDELTTKCIYNTKNRNRFTFGGEPTYQEMCYYFYTYYPRMNGYSNCLSFYDKDTLVNLFKDLAKESYTTISAQGAFDEGLLIWEGLQQLKSKTSATPAVLKIYEKFLNTSQFQSYCNDTFDSTSRQHVQPLSLFEEPNICDENLVEETTTMTPSPTSPSTSAPTPTSSSAPTPTPTATATSTTMTTTFKTTTTSAAGRSTVISLKSIASFLSVLVFLLK